MALPVANEEGGLGLPLEETGAVDEATPTRPCLNALSVHGRACQAGAGALSPP